MKTLARISIALAAFAAALVILAAPSPVVAAAAQEVVTFPDPLTATSTALTTKILDTSKYRALKVTVGPVHMAGGASRVYTVTCHDSAGNVSSQFDAVTATTNVASVLLIDPDIQASVGPTTGLKIITAHPCKRTRLNVNQASGTVRATVIGLP